MVGIAQLVRAPGCGPGGHRFESDYPPHLFFKTASFKLAFILITPFGVQPSGKATDFDSVIAGSIPAIPAKRPVSLYLSRLTGLSFCEYTKNPRLSAGTGTSTHFVFPCFKRGFNSPPFCFCVIPRFNEG